MIERRRERRKRKARGPSKLIPRRRVLVVCEGAVTEPGYIRGFQTWCRNPLVEVRIAGQHGVPRSLVQAALTHKRDADRKARNDANERYDHVWCVFDIDDHPGINDARQLAAANSIDLAISNPCFELWLLLHWRESPGARHRHDLQSMVARHLPQYDKHVDFTQLARSYGEAVVRARRLDDDAEKMGEGGRNPTTGVYRLTELIREP